MLETTLVTGATGFAGSHLLDRLADRAPLVAWYRSTGTPPDPRSAGELRRRRSLDRPRRKVAEMMLGKLDQSAVLHLAGADQKQPAALAQA